MVKSYQALVVNKIGLGKYSANLEKILLDDNLKSGEILIRAQYSSVNYKDLMSYQGHLGVTRRYPHVPGIDVAGIVEKSSSKRFRIGDKVLITASPLGMNCAGGYAEYVKASENWVIPLPDNLLMNEAMAYGTAGFTAALCVNEIVNLFNKQGMTVLISGATGGVGSLSAAILSKLGYNIIALTNKNDVRAKNFLSDCGVSEIINFNNFVDATGRPLLRQFFDVAIDTVGGRCIDTMIRSVKDQGKIYSTGMITSNDLDTSILPFILRGVSLIGINAESTTDENRQVIWEKLGGEWKPNLEKIITNRKLSNLIETLDLMIDKRFMGRVVVNLE